METARVALVAVVAAVCLAGVAAGSTPIVGTPVAGSLDFGAVQHNYFDPANGYVPEKYLNSSGCTVTISESDVEFGFADATAEISANFTESRLIVTDHLFDENSYKPFQLDFTNSAITSLTLVSDSFPSGSLTGSLAGGVITVNWNGGGFDDEQMFQAVYEVTLPATPRLSIRLSSTNAVLLSWPAPSTGFALQENRHLESTNWVNVMGTPNVTNGENQVTVSPLGRARFYRLKHP